MVVASQGVDPVGGGDMAIEQMFSKDAIAQIDAAVMAAEKKTEGEIVPMVVAVSDVYPAANLRFAIVAAGWLACLATYFLPHGFGYLTFAIWFFPLVIAGLFVVQHVPILKKLFLNRYEVEKETFERAVFEFSQHKIYKTKDRTGILIFVSLMERKVLVLADEGINAKVTQDTWDELVKNLIGAIKARRMAEGIATAITECGKILEKHFPATSNNVNQLPNRLIIK